MFAQVFLPEHYNTQGSFYLVALLSKQRTHSIATRLIDFYKCPRVHELFAENVTIMQYDVL